MSKKTSKTAIGAFVIGAIALAIISVVAFGSGKLFKRTVLFGMYFDGSVKGLDIGAPLMLSGVKIGSVTDIQLQMKAADLSERVYVLAEIEPDRIVTIGEKERTSMEGYKALIDKGLRAQLQSLSFVTGKLMVSLAYNPDTPATLRGGVEKGVFEIPTIPSTMEQIERTLANIDFEEIFDNLSEAVKGLGDVAKSDEIKDSIRSLNKTIKDADKLIVNVDKEIEPLIESVRNLSDNASATLEQAEKTLSFKEGETAALAFEVKNALREFSEAARAIRLLADYLERHPEALLKGKGE
jgi:paraquat-inducible protein B